MGTEVLRPQDLLARTPPTSFYRRRNFPGNANLTNLVVNRRPTYNAPHKKASPRPDKKKYNAAAESGGTKKVTNGGPVMGQVTILRRGEPLDSLETKVNGRKPNPRSPNQKPVDDLTVLGTNRIGPDSPVLLPKQIRLSPPAFVDVYAGSAFSLSPSPRSVPLPSFFNKKQQTDGDEIEPSNNPATRDLRRLLRLE